MPHYIICTATLIDTILLMVSEHRFSLLHFNEKSLSPHANLTVAFPATTFSVSCTSQSWLGTKLLESTSVL